MSPKNKTESEYFQSEEFQKGFEEQVNKTTWDIGLPKIIKEGDNIWKWYKDGRKIKINK